MMYTVFWVAGVNDGKTLGEFNNERDAIRFAQAFYEKHEDEFDPCCGGVAVVDAENNVVWDW